MSDYRDENDFENEREGNAGSERMTGLAIGLVLGSILGAGVALLMAPKAGVDTRRQLRTSARRLKSNATHAMEDLGNSVAEKARSAGHRTEAVVGDLKDQAGNIARGVKSAVDAGRKGNRG